MGFQHLVFTQVRFGQKNLTVFLLVLLSCLVARLQLLPDHDYDDWDAGIPVTAVGDNDDMQ